VLHIHREHDKPTVDLARHAAAAGIGIIWDNDDDLTVVPKRTEAYKDYGGLNGARTVAGIRRVIALADVVTTPSRRLAQRFGEYGAGDVRVIENHVPDSSLGVAAPRRNGEIVIGWMGGGEHRYDADRIPLGGVLADIVRAHTDVHVVTIGGVGIDLRHDRYRHMPRVVFDDLPRALAEFDIGLAPIVDMPLNQARSNVKLKEYAVVGVPWLASPIGPYAGMGEQQGGRLVPDDGWREAIERLLAKPRERRKLAKRALKWGQRQTISRNMGAWEAAYADARSRAQRRVGAAAAPQAGAGSAAR
jgi:glycosyltransferase involved in cell wall biosynthesis